MLHYHSGYNMPGYLPESDHAAYVFSTFVDARASLALDMTRHAESDESWADEHDCDDVPCPTYGDTCPDMMASEVRASAEDLASCEPSSSEWGGYGGNLAYWVHECHESICLDEEDRAMLAEHAMSEAKRRHPANYNAAVTG